ncbi:DUF5777 family beta-barrel protein [Flavobacterium undicola]|uniref:DUF5777 family beta-barrel protein n=1 Tax=Flavobacterium undicola TaxID=1932779 RepID=UPI0013769C34|nr:DUF5777 family beta-barrel protein [Flavobacterium undicola]MBA0883455.1 hypothetical protein [Flavobacterium undicola]
MNQIFRIALVVMLPVFSLTAQENMESYLPSETTTEKDTIPVYATFKSSRIINARSNELVHKGELELIVSHRFGDAGGHNGGFKTFYGTDNASDIKVAFDYGLTDRLAIGVSRTKGATAIRQLFESNVKYKLLEQTEKDRIPLGITFFGNAVISTMSSNINPKVPDHFDSFSDRWSFVAQMILTRKFSSNFSLALLPTYTHYNRVGYGDSNDIFAMGIGARAKLTKRMALIADYFYTFDSENRKAYFEKNGLPFYNPLSAGLEIETGGHVFQLTFMNNTALLENQFIPYTTTSWRKGQFRWGFSISRPFSFKKKNK